MKQPVAEVFVFCPRCAQRREDVGENPFRCAACGFTHFFSPVAAVGAIVADPEERVLFVRRAKDPGKGKLGLPGGFVDPDERGEAAVIREALEEVNLEVVDMRYLTSFPNFYTYKKVTFPVTDFFYVCSVESFESLEADGSEVDDWHLARPGDDELGNMAFESNRLALEAYLKE